MAEFCIRLVGNLTALALDADAETVEALAEQAVRRRVLLGTLVAEEGQRLVLAPRVAIPIGRVAMMAEAIA